MVAWREAEAESRYFQLGLAPESYSLSGQKLIFHQQINRTIVSTGSLFTGLKDLTTLSTLQEVQMKRTSYRAAICLGLPVVLALSLGACSSSADSSADSGREDETTSTSSVVTTTTVAPASGAFEYFEALAKKTRIGYETAATLSVGPAKEYALYQKEFLEAKTYAAADGQVFPKEDLETARIDDLGRILIESTESRITYSDFVFSYDEVQDFNVEGRQLRKNLASNVRVSECFTPTGAKCNSDVSIDLDILHAYVSATGDLILTYEFRIGSKATGAVREDRTGKGGPTHYLQTAGGTKINATWSVETFARGETRTNAVAFGPLPGGGDYSFVLNFRWDGFLCEFKGELGSFIG